MKSYWWPNVPYQADYTARLHNLSLQMSRGGRIAHSKVVRFGFRQSERKRADANHIYYYLNGIRVNLRGDNIQGADYDSIDTGGKGDAYDTFPGFLFSLDGKPRVAPSRSKLPRAELQLASRASIGRTHVALHARHRG